MENIIRKSIDGGWKPYPEVWGWGTIVNSGEEKTSFRFKIMSPRKTLFTVRHKEIVCDPLFWQALSKSCGWVEICSNPDHAGLDSGLYGSDNSRIGCPVCGHDSEYRVKSTIDNWKKYALRFYEINLTEGFEKAVEYLQNLIEQK